ncbi:sugar porter family MFS transporter [Dyadobacter arcticus]|uniref:Sugar porter (SP) family MFS transporter n=1 Tax=Dyadobacter arcticus TaxID=1078754 RepID=A0ABX0URR2_9BACT|nr:sugar porter family MFS transporter [Dyadobacter arcticus]NIJ54609.1 sugar porter (SP) family MFS transporter [Dyadobacter arcticus]
MAVTITTGRDVSTGNYEINKGYVYLISTIAALGGLLFGFDLVIISGTVSFFADHFRLSELETGWAVGCINLGAAIGAVIGGKLSETLGRKKLLMLCAVLFALTGAGTGWAGSFPLFVFFRMLSGVAVGAAALVCPMYVAEISPSAMRGRMVSFYQLSIVIGILLAYLSNYLLLNTGENNWRWMFSSQSAPSLFFFFGLFFVSESPRWLIGKGRNTEADQILARIGGANYARAESDQITLSFAEKSVAKVSDLFKKDVWHIVFIGIVIAVCSQAVGQNSLFSYAPELFKKAGMAQDSAFLQSIIIGVINFIFTFIAIATIDRAGRKKLLQYGSFLLFIDALALSTAFYLQLPGIWVLIFVLAFIAIYSATLGPVTWVALSEIFPNRIRGNALAMATLALWIANFFTTSLFPVMNKYFGLSATFLIHALICLAYFLFVRTRVPETKGQSLEEIERLLSRK